MVINGQISRYVLDGFFIVLIGTFSWIANKADTTVKEHETRLQAIERTSAETTVKLDYIQRDITEIKQDVKSIKKKNNADN